MFVTFQRCLLITKSFVYSQVVSDTGADGAGQIQQINGTVVRGTFIAEYHSIQIFAASRPTICEVYFTIQSSKVC